MVNKVGNNDSSTISDILFILSLSSSRPNSIAKSESFVLTTAGHQSSTKAVNTAKTFFIRQKPNVIVLDHVKHVTKAITSSITYISSLPFESRVRFGPRLCLPHVTPNALWPSSRDLSSRIGTIDTRQRIPTNAVRPPNTIVGHREITCRHRILGRS